MLLGPRLAVVTCKVWCSLGRLVLSSGSPTASPFVAVLPVCTLPVLGWRCLLPEQGRCRSWWLVWRRSGLTWRLMWSSSEELSPCPFRVWTVSWGQDPVASLEDDRGAGGVGVLLLTGAPGSCCTHHSALVPLVLPPPWAPAQGIAPSGMHLAQLCKGCCWSGLRCSCPRWRSGPGTGAGR